MSELDKDPVDNNEDDKEEEEEEEDDDDDDEDDDDDSRVDLTREDNVASIDLPLGILEEDVKNVYEADESEPGVILAGQYRGLGKNIPSPTDVTIGERISGVFG